MILPKRVMKISPKGKQKRKKTFEQLEHQINVEIIGNDVKQANDIRMAADDFKDACFTSCLRLEPLRNDFHGERCSIR